MPVRRTRPIRRCICETLRRLSGLFVPVATDGQCLDPTEGTVLAGRSSADARVASDHFPVKAIVAPNLGRRVHPSVG
jgi:hypothetical protein